MFDDSQQPDVTFAFDLDDLLERESESERRESESERGESESERREPESERREPESERREAERAPEPEREPDSKREPEPVPMPVPQVRREVEIDASPQEVWDAIATEEGRERWLEDDPDRELTVEHGSDPGTIVWWWRSDPADPPRRVEVRVVAVPAGARVIVTETAPLFPLTTLRAAFALVAA